MTPVGTFQSARWGTVTVKRGTYDKADGPTAIALTLADGEPLATLSLNMYKPDCSHDSSALPPDCFYVKEYGSHQDIARDALASGLFEVRFDLPHAKSGFISAAVWQVKP